MNTSSYRVDVIFLCSGLPAISGANTALATLVLLLTVGWMGNSPAFTRDSDTQSKLPGTRTVIQARNFKSIQHALDAVPDEEALVQLPAGKFQIDSPLVVDTGHTTLKGSGAGTQLQNVNEDGKPALILRRPKNKENKLWRVQLSDFRITGNKNSGHGIVADDINEVYVDNLTITEHGKNGLHMLNCYENPRVTNCQITYNNKTGLYMVGNHDIVVGNNEFEENGTGLKCINGFNLNMNGNNLDDHIGPGVVIKNTYGSVVSGNMIEECKGSAITLDRDCYGITLSSNVIAHNRNGIDLKDAHGCTVSANTFTISKSSGLRIGPNSGRITVTGNNFSDSHIGDGKVKRDKGDRKAAGLVLEETRDVTITGNVFSGLHTAAVNTKGKSSERIVFTGNVLRDNSKESELDTLKDSTVKNNRTD